MLDNTVLSISDMCVRVCVCVCVCVQSCINVLPASLPSVKQDWASLFLFFFLISIYSFDCAGS